VIAGSDLPYMFVNMADLRDFLSFCAMMTVTEHKHAAFRQAITALNFAVCIGHPSNKQFPVY
jgi:hypothetical protein